MPSHLQNVQALRGIACLMVVWFHLLHWDTQFGRPTPIFREVRWFGFAGVDLFFVLSGFIITATNRRDIGRPRAVPSYLFRRFWRLYPAYWAAMALTAAFFWVAFGHVASTPEAARDWPVWLTILPGDVPNPLIPQAWTLGFEVMFYVTFGGLMLLPPRWAAAGLCAWAAGVVVALAGPEAADPVATNPGSAFVFEFLGGCLVAWLAGRGERRGWRIALALGLVYAVVGIVLVNVMIPKPFLHVMAWPRPRVLIFGPPAVLIVYGCVAAEGRWPRRVPGWLLRIGDASYSLYLLHCTVMVACVLVGTRLPHSRVPHLLWLAGTFAAAVGSSLLFHRWVERPLLDLVKRKKPRPEPRDVATEPPARKAA